MAVLGLSFNHFYINITEKNGKILSGSIARYSSINKDEECDFIICSLTYDGKVEIKSVDSLFKLKKGIEVGGTFSSLDNSFTFKVAAPGIMSKFGSYVHEINTITDLPEFLKEVRYNSLITDARGKRWNVSFLEGTPFSYDNFDKSFLSINSIFTEKNTYVNKDIPKCILLSNRCVLIKNEALNYYKDNGVIFLSSDSSNIKNYRISKIINLQNYISNIDINLNEQLKLSKPEIEKLGKYSICLLDNKIDLNLGFSVAKFAKNIRSFKNYKTEENLLIINPSLNGSFINAMCSNGYNGIIEIKNENTLSENQLKGSYQGDYAREFLEEDDDSVIVLNVDDKHIIVGIANTGDMEYNSGIVKMSNKFVPEGKDSFGAFSSNLTNSGNYLKINGISFYFDDNFIRIAQNVLEYLGDASKLEAYDIGIPNNSQLEIIQPIYDRAEENIKVLSCHNEFAGEKLPSIIDGKYSEDNSCENYVPGSSFLERNVRPILQNVNKKGNSFDSIGIGFMPNYAFQNNQSKSYFIEINGNSDLYIPYVSNVSETISKVNFSIKEKISLSFDATDSYSKNQHSNMIVSKSSAVDNGKLLCLIDNKFKYIRPDGSPSNVYRHNDASVLFSLSLHFLSFIYNNQYSRQNALNQIVVFGFSDEGASGAVNLSMQLWNINKKISQLNYENKEYIVNYHDRDLAIYEASRLIKSIRSFSNDSKNPVYNDLIQIINYYSKKYPNSIIKDFRSKIIDSVNLICNLPFYATKFGDPDVDVFQLVKNSSGKTDLSNINENIELNELNRNFNKYNLSNTVGNISGVFSILADNSAPIWSGCKIFNNDIVSYYGFRGPNYVLNPNVSKAIEAIVSRWIDTINHMDGLINGYIINCRDDVSLVNDSEMAARSQVLVESIIHKSKLNKNNDFIVGVSYSPVSKRGVVKNYNSNISYGYFYNSKRIINRIVEPSIKAGARVILQESNIDQIIYDVYENIDNVSKNTMDSIGIIENIYDPDNIKEHKLIDDGKIISSFFPVHINGYAGLNFISIENLKGKNYVNSYEEYLIKVYPQGKEIKDSNISFDRFNIRKNVTFSYQNMISAIINEVVIFTNNYKITKNPIRNNKFFQRPIDASKNYSKRNRMTNNLYMHNFFSSCLISMGEEVLDFHITHNTFYSPYVSLRSCDLHAYNNISNFNLPKIFNRKASNKENYLEKNSLIEWGIIGNAYSSLNELEPVSENIKVPGASGNSYNENDILLNQPSQITYGYNIVNSLLHKTANYSHIYGPEWSNSTVNEDDINFVSKNTSMNIRSNSINLSN